MIAPNLSAIVAMSRNRVIGANGTIPWHLPEDLRWFKERTMGAALLMGRKTYDSIGRPLPGRRTFVVSRTAEIAGVEMIPDLAAFDPATIDTPVYIVGGSEIYAQMLPRCASLYVTQLPTEAEGDTFMPPFEHDFPQVSIIRETEKFQILHYSR
ncbi:MAG: dihydrofolate reductase [Chthoniobacterales bacterium]